MWEDVEEPDVAAIEEVEAEEDVAGLLEVELRGDEGLGDDDKDAGGIIELAPNDKPRS